MKLLGIAHVRYIKIPTRLRGFLVFILIILGLVFFVLNFLLGIERQWSRSKFAILTLKPHVRILMHRTWAINYPMPAALSQSWLKKPKEYISNSNYRDKTTMFKKVSRRLIFKWIKLDIKFTLTSNYPRRQQKIEVQIYALKRINNCVIWQLLSVITL